MSIKVFILTKSFFCCQKGAKERKKKEGRKERKKRKDKVDLPTGTLPTRLGHKKTSILCQAPVARASRSSCLKASTLDVRAQN